MIKKCFTAVKITKLMSIVKKILRIFEENYEKGMTDRYVFSTEIAVRDYELDSEGIVNNAIYLHYLELTRHAFCVEAGFSFKDMTARGMVPVVSRIEADYKTPLHSGDVVVSKLWVELQGVRFIFHQDLFDKATGSPVLSAVVTIVTMQDGRLSRGNSLAEYFKDYV